MTLQFKKKDVDLDNVVRIIRATDAAVDLRNPHTEPRVPEQVRASAQVAAVAMLIVDKPNPTVIFTRRHPGIRFGGQYCFPGGKADSGDNSIEETVRREIREEIEVTASGYQMIGSLGRYHTQTGFCITPFVGIVTPDYTVVLNPAEVTDLKEVLLEDLLNPDHYQLVSRAADRAHYHFRLKGFEVSGPTVSMMINFAEIISRNCY